MHLCPTLLKHNICLALKYYKKEVKAKLFVHCDCIGFCL